MELGPTAADDCGSFLTLSQRQARKVGGRMGASGQSYRQGPGLAGRQERGCTQAHVPQRENLLFDTTWALIATLTCIGIRFNNIKYFY
jgi:hypothetical protein